MHPSLKALLLVPAMAVIPTAASRAAHPSQGLWVGEVALNAVNEATGAVGDSNTYEFSDPEIPTPTSDTAFLRLIVHVNGAGQASLLKSVAIVEREVFADGGTDILLITDPKLYPQFPGIAKRIASTSFDFGDQQAVTAVQAIIDTATGTAVSKVIAADGGTQSVIEAEVLGELQNVAGAADVDAGYLNRATGATSFITTDFFSEADVDTIADEVARLIDAGTRGVTDFGYDPQADGYAPFPSDPLGGNFAALVAKAKALRDNSFYRDTRGLEAISGVCHAAAVAAAEPAADLAAKQAAVRAAARDARHNAADVTQAYNRFLAGAAFNALRTAIPDPAVAAALDAQGRGLNETQIVAAVRDALILEAPVSNAFAEAAALQAASLWGDTRAQAAVNRILDAVSAVAAAEVLVSTSEPVLKQAVGESLATAFDATRAAPVFTGAPSGDYSDFVTASGYLAAVETAARTATSEALFQYNAGVTGSDELEFLTQRAVNRALVTIRNAAASLSQSSIPLRGSLTAGGSLDGTIHLPALAPTNPFMHRRHPDHTEGFPITRRISLAVDQPAAGESGRAGYGVSRVSGTYSEEIFGLHKPLGADRNVGLRTRGSFTLNRLSFVESLNF
ncbi:MAG TPA: hypothetical protein VLO11_15005 [Luteolibacter sp.]|nr:hypothetical protein [Luteolibacter sp.]